MPKPPYEPGHALTNDPLYAMKPTKLEFWLRLFAFAMSAAFGAGLTIATTNGRISTVENRVSDIERARPQETAWRVEQNATAIATMQSRADKVQQDVANINVQIGAMNQKMDFVVDALKQRERDK